MLQLTQVSDVRSIIDTFHSIQPLAKIGILTLPFFVYVRYDPNDVSLIFKVLIQREASCTRHLPPVFSPFGKIPRAFSWEDHELARCLSCI